MDFIPLYAYFIAVSFIVSLIVNIRNKELPVYLKLFPPYLFVTLMIEVYAAYLSSVNRNNIVIYNFFTTFEFCFYFWILSLVISKPVIKKTLRVVLLAYLIIALINILFIQKIDQPHTVTYALGSLLIAIFCVYYIFELFGMAKTQKITHNSAFWICIGLLFFYCCAFPLFGLINYWAKISRLVVDNFETILTILNVFLYSVFTIAFLCQIKTRKYTSSR